MNQEMISMTEVAVKDTIQALFPEQRPILITEGKSYGTRRAFSDEKQTLMNTLVQLVGSLKGNLDQKLIKDSIAAYDDLKDAFKDALFGLLKSYQANEIDAATFNKLMQDEIRQAWANAYEAGVGAAGNPFGVYDEDLTFLKGARQEEFGYLKSFTQDMEDEEGTMSYEDRLQMYVDTLDGAYNNGKVEASPENVEIYWELDPSAKNCDDCIERADPDNNPYTKDNLPGVPGDGSCQCLSNCKCSLRITQTGELPEPGLGFIGAVPTKPPRIPAGKQLPTYQEYEYMSGLSTEIERLRGLISSTSGSVKSDFIAMRRDVNADLIDYMDKHDLYYVPKSNYFQGSENPFLKESLEYNPKPAIPYGYRTPSDKEKSKIDSLLLEVNSLRYQIASGANGNTKDLIKQRQELTEEVIEFMERHKIYYVPRELLPSNLHHPTEMLSEQLSHKITATLFGAPT